MKQATFLSLFIACLSFNLSANNKIDCQVKTYRDSIVGKIVDMHEMLQEIINTTGLETDFELKEANVLNIEASISHKKKYILYNPDFINSLNNATKNDKWAIMTLLAHEMGHHLNGHTARKGGSKPALELQADEFAGFAMHKLGATLLQSQNVMFYISKTEESKTHPARSSRLLAIERGWNKASGIEEKTAIILH